MLLRQFAPSLLADATLVDLESRYERQAASPGTAMAMTRMITDSRHYSARHNRVGRIEVFSVTFGEHPVLE